MESSLAQSTIPLIVEEVRAVITLPFLVVLSPILNTLFCGGDWSRTNEVWLMRPD